MRTSTLVLFLILTVIPALGLRPVIAQEGSDSSNTASDTPPVATTLPASGPGSNAAVVVLEGDINDYASMMLQRRFQSAREAGATTVILQIDTYGGFVHSGLQISRFIKRQDDLYVIAYIPEKAISAGAMIAVACREIVMEPGAQIGNSGVITGSGQQLSGTERAKAESMVIEEFYDSARRNGHPPLLLEAMVVMERTVHWVENTQTGERRFVNSEQYKQLIAEEHWRPVPGVRDPIDAADTLLTLSSELAVELGLASEESHSLEGFIASRQFNIVGRFAPQFGDRVVAFLNGFMIRGLLITVLMFALYMSFSTPGQGVPEVIALTALSILVGVPLLTGYAQWYEMVAVLLGIMLIAVEIFVLPGFGIAGITGIFLLLAGLTMTFVPPIKVPDMPIGFGVSFEAVGRGLAVVVSALACSLLLWFWLQRYLPKIPHANKLILTAVAGGGTLPIDDVNEAHIPEPTQPTWPVVGSFGRAVSDLRPGGTAAFYDPSISDERITDVISDSGYVKAGTKLVVRQVEGLRVVVRPLSDPSPPST